MTRKPFAEKHSILQWCVYGLLLIISAFLALGSGYMAYQLTQDHSVTAGFAGIGFYLIHDLGRSLFPDKSK